MRYKDFIILKFLIALLMTGGVASAQVVVEGNVYGGCNLGQVTADTKVTVNDGTIGVRLPLASRINDTNGQHPHVDYGNVYGGGKGDKQTGTKNTTVEGYSLTVPIYDREAGLVMGNTDVTVKGGAVVRRAVYGGGNMSTVGVCTVDANGVATYTSGGIAKVTIEGNALIGPTKKDLTKHENGTTPNSQEETDEAFKYIGGNEGMVFGSSRGLSGGALKSLSFADSTVVIVQGNAQVVGNVFGGGENGHVQKGTHVEIKGNAVIGGVPLHGGNYDIVGGEYDGVHLQADVAELTENNLGAGSRIFRGNVFGGGLGTEFIEWWKTQHGLNRYCYTAGRVYGNTTVKVSENAKIYNRVYGGGTIASVGTFLNEDATNSHAITGLVANTGKCFVTISGGTIGSPVSNGMNCGEVYGGGHGLAGRAKRSDEPNYLLPLHQVVDEAYVGHTYVNVTGGTIMSNVYGGGANGHVEGNTNVTVTGGTIGTEGYGGWHGNVYGGGGGTMHYWDTISKTPSLKVIKHLSLTAGRVFGNTNVNIKGGTVVHNVYGGGSLATVGKYDLTENSSRPWLSGGVATVNITGGRIGSHGYENGMVYGSGRGEIDKVGSFFDSLTYVARAVVNIGKSDTTTTTTGEGDDVVTTTTVAFSGDAKINGSVYGSGENGHVYLNTQVNIYSGTIGCSAAEYAKYLKNAKLYKKDPSTNSAYKQYCDSIDNFPNRGNIYGAGCGTDQYLKDGKLIYNPLAGYVQGNTEVNINGGYISRSVYGAGAMASVGVRDNKATVKHLINKSGSIATSNFNTNDEAALSWPYELTFAKIIDSLGNFVTTGKSTVNVYGGHIGTDSLPAASGNVFGSARGDVGPLYHLDTLALVRETEVNIDYSFANSQGIEDPNVIIGTVYGSGENGQTYENTKVTINNGFIAGSVFGGGMGDDTYKDLLMNPNSVGNYLSDSSSVRSITAGKVYGNTEVIINGGKIRHNVFGGGKNASVGKGNYMGYGELTSADPATTPYMSSGKCTVKIYDGEIGTNGHYDSIGIFNGFVYGSSKGVAYSSVTQSPRYNYSRDFFLAYSNETEVIIGDPTKINDQSYSGPRIWGSVFGGGEDGHVRWNTDVTVNKGEIGEAYTYSGTALNNKDSLKLWVYRGNVYGAGRGIDHIGNTDDYCSSSGSVTLKTNVTVYGGKIHRNVYGGGSNASVGPPPTGYNPGTSLNTVKIYGGTIGQEGYGSDIFGGSRGEHDLLNTENIASFANSKATEVYIYGNMDGTGGADIYQNVYGGGEIGQTGTDTKVFILGGSVGGSVYGGGKGDRSDEKSALVKGNATVDMSGGIVERSVYGGGEIGSVGTFTTKAGTPVDIPTSFAANTGLATVLISGGSVGKQGSLMPWENHDIDDDDRGYVFCGGRGEADSINYPKAVAMGVVGSTYLEISNTTETTTDPESDETTTTTTAIPLVTASVYGGSENGLVLGDTYVKIMGGQIGSGFVSKAIVNGVLKGTFDPIYTEEQWEAAIAAVKNETIGTKLAVGGTLHNVFHECDAWPYGIDDDGDDDTPKVYKVFDHLANETGHPNIDASHPAYNSSDVVGSTGSSFFGNVFGGGSGFYPIAPGVWRRTAGQVNGNTHVEITGGHILTSVYGGNEQTDVLGTCTVEMSGGTIGVPRTIDEIVAHPVTCYLFGGGKGDQRVLFNLWTNVDKTVINVTGGHIFGSVFGGGEEGHVLNDVELNVGGSVCIGTQGLSYVDGNIFGGGRGFSGEALTAGAVCGNVTVNINGGTMLGSIYGGGRLASVGTYLAPVGHENYGKMQEGDNHGFIKVNISGGKIGNSRPYIYVSADDFTTLKGGSGDLRNMTYGSVRVKAGKQTQTDFNNILRHTISGNVFGGSMGRITRLDGSVNPIWPDLARCKKTRVTVSGDAKILSSVYGGGEIGIVRDSTTVNILGGTIGSEVRVAEDDVNKNALNVLLVKYSNPTAFATYFYDTDPDYYDPTLRGDHAFIDALPTSYSWYTRNENYPHYADNTYPHYFFGSVYGGGYGSEDVVKETNLDVNHCYELVNNHAPTTLAPVDVAGRVFGNTYVNVMGGTVRENVFGGGDMASVGTNVYDATSGDMTGTLSNKGICTVTVGNTVADADYASAHDGVAAGDIIASPTIGPLDFTGMNANVYAAGRGVAWDPSMQYNPYCNVDSTKLTVSGGRIWGSTFGGGADCHVLGNTGSFIQEGAYIGDKGITEFDGYVFGGGRNYYNSNPAAGRVQGNAYVVMTGGRLMCSIIGGGCMARVGVDVDGDISSFVDANNVYDSALHGNTVIYVSGKTVTMTKAEFNANTYYKNTFYGTTDPAVISSLADDDNVTVYKTAIGTGFGPYLLDCDYSIGDIFGGGKGDTRDTLDVTAGRVMNTYIYIAETPRIMADIYAGGEMGCIGWYDITGENVNKYYGKTGYTHLEMNGTPYLGTPYEFSTTNFRAGVTWSIVDPYTKRLLHTCSGNVYGGGQGFVCDGYSNWVSMGRVRHTRITINGVKMMGNVFGGGSRGWVMEDANVTVTGGLIGCEIEDSTDDDQIEIHRRYYYGSVFGGGYGNPTTGVFSTLCDSTAALGFATENLVPVGYAGRICGNTNVNVTGGQIMDCVFGGGDLASVGYVPRSTTDGKYILNDPSVRKKGLCTVNVGGTAVIGPLDYTGQNAYVYGGGRGRASDPEGIHNEFCNVNKTKVTINLTGSLDNYSVSPENWNPATHGGRIWGSIFGGGADSHVLGDVSTTLTAGIVGTKGVTSYDGNIFGGGRDYLASNHTNGRVGGNVEVMMTGGRLMGTIFGGGRLALTGVDVDGDVSDFMITEDGKQVFDSANHGLVQIDVSGGEIGNPVGEILLNGDGSEHSSDESNGDIFGSGKGDTKNYEDILYGRVMNSIVNVNGSTRVYSSIYGGGEMAGVGWWGSDGKFVAKTGTTKVNVSGTTTIGSQLEYTPSYLHQHRDDEDDWTYMVDGRLVHACTGNVVGGSQGDVDLYSPHWVSFGRSRMSHVNISGTPTIMGNVYGGAEQGIVTEDAHVKITGGTIGTIIPQYTTTETNSETGEETEYKYPLYHFGSVFGGGYGSERFWDSGPKLDEDGNPVEPAATINFYHDSCVFDGSGNMTHYLPATRFAGRVYGNTYVDISGGTIRENVFGGGNMASVGYVEPDGDGKENLSDADKRHNGICNVWMHGTPIVGPLDYTGHNAYVFGAGRGVGNDPDEDYRRFCNVNGANLLVEITSNGNHAKSPNEWNVATDGGRIWGSMFGGGGDCHVLGDVSTTYRSGLLGTNALTTYDGNIFGGGRNYMNSNHTNGRVQGNISIRMNGGWIMGTIFGGGRMALSGVDVNGNFIDKNHGNVTINVTGNAKIGNDNSKELLTGNESIGDIFGSGKGDTKNYDDIWSGRVTNSTVNIFDSTDATNPAITYSPTIYGAVFGGGEMASLGYWDNNNVFYPNTGEATVTVTGGVTIGTLEELSRYTKPVHEKQDERVGTENPGLWTKYGDDGKVFHTCTGNVIGGCQGDVDISAPHWVSLGRSRTSTVTIGTKGAESGPNIMGCVFGGSEQGVVTENTKVTVYSGTIGTHVTTGSGAGEGNDYYYGDVYGGSYGSDEAENDNDTYTYTDEYGIEQEADAVNDSSYARAALGLSDKASVMAGRVYGNSQVDMLGGHVLGSVYGGGSFAYLGYENGSSYGQTYVNIGLPNEDTPQDASLAIGNVTIDGGVYGANNFSGTPFGNTNVHIYKTAHKSGNAISITKGTTQVVDGNYYPFGLKGLATPDDKISLEDFAVMSDEDSASLSDVSKRFALKEVYGGGNKANHEPVAADGSTLVHVHFCEENTICDLYGGGSEANTKNNHVIVDGGRIHRVFGGGNGSIRNNKSADVSGIANTEIHGGFIDYVFGGANQNGNIGTVQLSIDNDPEQENVTCQPFVLNVFGGSNDAATESDIVTTIGCGARGVNFYGGSNNASVGTPSEPVNVTLNVLGGVFTNIYGGSKGTYASPDGSVEMRTADIYGDVTLNFFNGNVKRIFGGSHENGNVYGMIQVNVYIDDEITCPDRVNIDYVFGAGDMAGYSPRDGSMLSPEVNIYKAHINYEVYGGGSGNRDKYGVFHDASISSNPVVNIGPAYNNPKTGQVEYREVTIGFGKSDPQYNTRFPIVGGVRDISRNGNVFGGGNASPTQGNTKVSILNNSHVFGGVYGGGNNATVTGNTDVQIGE